MSGYKLLRITDELVERGVNGRKATKRVLVEYKIRRGKARLQWYARSYINSVFGYEQVKLAEEEWERVRPGRLGTEGNGGEAAGMDEEEGGQLVLDESELPFPLKLPT